MKTYLGLAISATVLCVLAIGRLCGQTTQPHQDILSLNTDGFVTDELGKPIAGATVQVIRREPAKEDASVEVMQTMTSDESGKFHLEINLPIDPWHVQYLIRGTKQNRGMAVVTIEAGDDDKHFYEFLRQKSQKQPWFILLPGRSIAGTVVDDQDHPVPNCKVSVDVSAPVTTGVDGKFKVENVPNFGESLLSSVIRIRFSQPDFVFRQIRVPDDENHIDHEADGSWKVVLQRGVVVNGTMTDADTGQPLSGTGIECFAQTEDLGGFDGSADADDKGHYSLRVPTVQSVLFRPFALHGPDSPSRKFAAVQKEDRENLDNAGDTLQKDFAFRKGQMVSGKVTADGAADLHVVYVSLMGGRRGQGIESGSCNKDGTFELGPVVAGSYAVEAQVGREATPHTPVEVTDGQDATGIELPIQIADLPANKQTLHGLVMNADGTPAVLATLTLRSNDHDRRTDTVYTGLDGSFEIPGIDASDNQTLWVCSADRSGAANVDFSNGVDTRTPQMVQLSPTQQISGKALDDDNKPVAGARVALCDVMQQGRTESHRSLASTYTDAQGNYTLRGFVPPKVTDNLRLEAMLNFRPHRSMQTDGYKLADDLKSDHALTGYNFRIVQSDTSVKITTDRDQ